MYGSGGFTSYSISDLEAQLSGWVSEGIPAVNMKIGARPEEDLSRMSAARKAIGADTLAQGGRKKAAKVAVFEYLQ